MPANPTDTYLAAFAARCIVLRRPGQPLVDEPGVYGLVSSAQNPLTRLVVVDDRAYDVLPAVLPDATAGMIRVFETAPRCAELIGADPNWRPSSSTAMVCSDLDTMPDVPLPRGLMLKPVRRLGDDSPDGVPLADAVATAVLADPAADESPDEFADYLRSLPPQFRLFAAVDSDGVTRATSGCGVFGDDVQILFVNTHPDWRRRGIGLAMTAAALRAARDHGGRLACLDATRDGVPIYVRLKFDIAAPMTRFSRRE